MSAPSWILFAVCAAAALVLIGYLYRKREMPGHGRSILAALRFAAIALILLLLFDPELPATALATGTRGAQVLLDASLSMVLPEEVGGGSRWSRAAEQARQLAGDRDVLAFGEGVRAMRPDSLPAASPSATASRLLPALQAASEAGVRRVVVLSDGAIDDAAEVARWLPRLGVDIDYRTVGSAVPNAAVSEVEAPGWAEAGKPLEIRFGVTGIDRVGESVDVYAAHGEQVLATQKVTLPEPGRVATGTLNLTPTAPPGGGLVRYDIRLGAGDATADDDVRSIYVFVSDQPAGVALVSFRPDWEPRFLQPVLEQALGIPVRGFLRTRDGDFIRMAEGVEAGGRVPEAEVRKVMEAADLLVLHGLDAYSPGWVGEPARRARRLLVLPAGEAAGLGVPVELGRAVPGDWYATSEVPASPVASLLAGIDMVDAPPLTALHYGQVPEGAWVPLNASRGRRGAPTPLAVAGESAGRRWAVALGTGYWRWAFRGGASSEAYARLWGALSGWILQEHGALASAAVRPASRVVPRGGPLRWVAPGLAPDSLRIRMTAESGEAVRDTVVVAQADTASTPAVAPGHYAYEVTAYAEGAAVATSEGSLTVESYSPEFTRPMVTLQMLEASAVPVGPGSRGTPGRPLHSSAWPYALIVLLIAAEWVLRRRWGLR